MLQVGQSKTQHTTTLYFGEAVDVEAFIHEVIDTGLADGATLTAGAGYWVGPDGLEFEIAQVVTIATEFTAINTLVGVALSYAGAADETAVGVDRAGYWQTLYT